MQRYKFFIHVKPIAVTANGQHVLMQQEENLVFKRYGETEDAAMEALRPLLCEFYHNDWEVSECKLDKSYKSNEGDNDTGNSNE